MIHIEIFLFAVILFFVGIISMIVGAWLRDQRAMRDEGVLRRDFDELHKIVNDQDLILINYKNLDEKLTEFSNQAVDGFKMFPSDWERGRVSAFRQVILYLRGRI
jgi:hypothetical protein